jgi:hypothetical protein
MAALMPGYRSLQVTRPGRLLEPHRRRRASCRRHSSAFAVDGGEVASTASAGPIPTNTPPSVPEPVAWTRTSPSIASTLEVRFCPRSSTGSKTSAYPLLVKVWTGVFRKPSLSRPARSAESTAVGPTAVPIPPSSSSDPMTTAVIRPAVQ